MTPPPSVPPPLPPEDARAKSLAELEAWTAARCAVVGDMKEFLSTGCVEAAELCSIREHMQVGGAVGHLSIREHMQVGGAVGHLSIQEHMQVGGAVGGAQAMGLGLLPPQHMARLGRLGVQVSRV